MDNKRIARIVITIVIIIFAFALLEIAIRAIVGLIKNVSDKMEERKQEKMEYNSEAQQAQRQVKAFLDEVFEAMNHGDMEYAFNCLREDYQEYMFHSDIDEFKEYVRSNLKLTEDYEYTNIIMRGGLYLTTVKFSDGERSYENRFTVRIVDEEKCNFMLGEYTSFKKRDETANYKDIRFYLNYEYATQTSKVYVIDIANQSNEDVNIDFTENGKYISTSGFVYVGSKPIASSIKAGDTYRIRLVFSKEAVGESSLELYTTINGTNHMVKLNFGEEMS